MDIGRIAATTNPLPNATTKSSTEQTASKNTSLAADNSNVDKFVKESEVTYTPAYTKANTRNAQTNASTDQDKGIKIEKPTSFIAMKNASFKQMVQDTIGKQSGLAFDAIMKDRYQIENGTIDDYWSADQTAQRIYDFARTLAGDDDSKLETLKNAVIEGFRQAGAAFSKKSGEKNLPGVCNDTYDKVMGMFDDWQKEIDAKKTDSTSKVEKTDKSDKAE